MKKYRQVVKLPYGMTARFCEEIGISQSCWYRWRDLSFGKGKDWGEHPEGIRNIALNRYHGEIAKVEK